MRSRLAILLVLSLAASGSAYGSKAGLAGKLPASPKNRWVNKSKRPNGIALVIHGLNQRPTQMGEVTTLLAKQGVDSYAVTLTGHDGNAAAFSQVSRDVYLRDVAHAYEQAAGRAKALGVPLYLTGFSLGGALGVDLLSHKEGVHFDKMLLFAPGIAPKHTGVLRVLGTLLPKLKLPSFAKADMRANSKTPINAYLSVVESADALKRDGYAHTDAPALIFSDPKDALVSQRGLKKIADAHQGAKWEVVSIDSKGQGAKASHHHLVVSRDSVGAEEWQKMEAQIKSFLAHP